MANRIATLLFVLMAVFASPAAAAPRSAASTQPSAKARVSFADCVEALKAQGGGWCEMAGATIADVFPKQFPPNVWGWSGPQSVILAWNGAAWDGKRRKWYFYGGGHTDYGGNEVYEFDLKSATFTRLTDPSAIPNKTPDNKCPEPVSGPRSEHTYDGIIFSSVTDTIWVFPGGTGYCNGGIVNLQGKVWEFNPDRTDSRNGIPPLSWRLNPIEMPAPLRSFLRSAELPDGRIYVANNDQSAFFDPRTGAWTLSSTRADFGDGNMIYDPATESYWETTYSDFISGRPGSGAIDRLSKHVFATSSGSGLAIVDGKYVYAWNGGHDMARWDVATKRWSGSRNAAGPNGNRVYSKFVWLEPERVFLGYSNPREGVWVYRPPQDGWTEAAMTPAQRYIDQARPGSTVEIPPGIYGAGIVIEKPLTVRLKGVTFGSPVGGKAYIVVEGARPVVIDDFTTTRPPGCASNCAGVRADGDFDITIRHAHIAHTEMGILTGNEGKGKLTVEDSLIEDMGGGDSSLSHGIYFGVGDTLIVRNTTVQRGHNLGHLIKSRARRTVIDHVKALGLDGVYSRELEFPCGGNITVKNSVIEKGLSTDNAELLAVNIEYKPGLPPGDPQQRNCGINAGQKTSFIFTDNWVIFDRKAVPPERAYNAGPNQFGKWRNLPPGTPMIVKSNKFVGMKSWGEFPDLSSENTMYRDRTAARLGPYPVLPRPGR